MSQHEQDIEESQVSYFSNQFRPPTFRDMPLIEPAEDFARDALLEKAWGKKEYPTPTVIEGFPDRVSVIPEESAEKEKIVTHAEVLKNGKGIKVIIKSADGSLDYQIWEIEPMEVTMRNRAVVAQQWINGV